MCESRLMIQYEGRLFTEDNSSGVTTGVCVCVHVCLRASALQRGIMSSALKGGGGVEGLMKGPLCPTCRLSAVVSLLKRQLFLRRSV